MSYKWLCGSCVANAKVLTSIDYEQLSVGSTRERDCDLCKYTTDADSIHAYNNNIAWGIASAAFIWCAGV
jgi:hypothetical protein